MVTLRRFARFDALVVTALVWFLGKFLRYAFPPLFGTLQDAYGVSTAVVGTAFSGLMLVYALAQFPSGTLADRLGAVRIIAGGAVVAAVGALSLAVVDRYRRGSRAEPVIGPEIGDEAPAGDEATAT